MLGANGQEIEMLGKVHISILLDGSSYDVTAIVCDIVPDGILGQDFLLEHATHIDYNNTTIHTHQKPINCWIGGQTQARCRVTTVCETRIPPSSVVRAPVEIEEVQSLSSLALLSATKSRIQNKSIRVIEGVLESNKEVSVCLVNTSDNEVVIPKNVPVGICESYYETPEEPKEHCRSTITLDGKAETSEILPEHLTDLFERSRKELKPDQEKEFKRLLIKYQNVFAKSSEDLGRSNSIQHKINTGSAVPLRQPTRRQPIGKREIEKQEVHKMLEKGIIEPSKSDWSSPIVLVKKERWIH